MNQLFIFRKIGALPKIFGDLKFDSKNMDKTLIEYANEAFGKSVIFNFPFDMIDCGEFVREVYPHSIVMGLLDDINKFNDSILKHLSTYDYIILYSENLIDIISSRSYLKDLMHIRPGFKRIVILKIDNYTNRDDIELFLDMSRIYNYKPVLLVDNDGNVETLDYIHYLVSTKKTSQCITKWFNYKVLIYFLKSHTRSITMLMRYGEQDVKMIIFRDCIAFFCHGHGQTSVSSLIRFLYENTKPLLKIGDVLIDEEFLYVSDFLDKYKSIRTTSKTLGASYTRIRKTIKELEKLEKSLGVQLIETRRGGSEHGKTMYTHIGKIVLDNIKELYSDLLKAYSNVINSTLEELRQQGDEPICIFPLSI